MSLVLIDSHTKILTGSLLFMAALTMVTLLVMFKRRVRGLRSGEIKVRQFGTYETEDQMPAYALQGSRHYKNLFEMPVLFYVVVLLAMVTQTQQLWTSILAAAFCLVRAWHAFIHLGSNNIILRMRVFAFSLLILTGLWALVCSSILLK